MSLVSNGSLNENTTPYIGIFSRSGLRPNALVELGGALQRVGLLAEDLAHRRRAGRQRPERRMPVELAPAGDRALAADVERAERVELAGIRDADDHAELLLHRRVGGGRLHAAEFERRAFVLVEIGQDGRGLDGLRRELERRAGAHHAGRLRQPARRPPSPARWRRRCRRARGRDSAARPRQPWSRPTGSPRAARRSSPLRDETLWSSVFRLVQHRVTRPHAISAYHARHADNGIRLSTLANDAIVRQPGRTINRGVR